VPLSPQTTESRLPYWFFDSRSLALFRILLGLTCLWSTLDLLPNLSWFVGSHAVLTAEAAWSGYTVKPWLFTLLFLFPGSDLAAWAVALIACGGAIMLAIGWRPRLGAFACWLAFGTIMARNPLTLHSGDSFMLLMLLFAMMLPIDRHFRIGAPSREPVLVCNFASSLWLFQIAILYLNAGLAKAPVESWRDGTHLSLLLGGTEIPTAFGSWLGQFGTLNRIGTVSSLLLELALPILLLALPARWQRTRSALLLALVLFHATIGLTLQVGLFAMLSLSAASTLIPPLLWERLPAWSGGTRASLQPSSHRLRQILGASALALLFTWQMVSFLYPQTFPFPKAISAALSQLRISQRWPVFVQTPYKRTRWAIELVSEKGARIDLLLGPRLLPQRFYELPSETERFGGARWRFLIFDQFVHRPATRPLIPRFLEMQARRLVDDPDTLENATLELVLYAQFIEESGSNQFYREVLGSTEVR